MLGNIRRLYRFPNSLNGTWTKIYRRFLSTVKRGWRMRNSVLFSIKRHCRFMSACHYTATLFLLLSFCFLQIGYDISFFFFNPFFLSCCYFSSHFLHSLVVFFWYFTSYIYFSPSSFYYIVMFCLFLSLFKFFSFRCMCRVSFPRSFHLDHFLFYFYFLSLTDTFYFTGFFLLGSLDRSIRSVA